jgi:phytoene dehydrogenase-like protein
LKRHDVNIETPVKNLYIGSCWAMQIGGVPGALAAAYQCAKKIKDEAVSKVFKINRIYNILLR